MGASLTSLRSRAAKVGLRFHKSTAPYDRDRNMGGYRVVSLSPSYVVAGGNYDQEIEDIIEWIEQWGG